MGRVYFCRSLEKGVCSRFVRSAPPPPKPTPSSLHPFHPPNPPHSCSLADRAASSWRPGSSGLAGGWSGCFTSSGCSALVFLSPPAGAEEANSWARGNENNPGCGICWHSLGTWDLLLPAVKEVSRCGLGGIRTVWDNNQTLGSGLRESWELSSKRLWL